jgi:hypothetical protein
MQGKMLYATVTGEHFQPVRLHYDLLDPQGWERATRRLRCIQHDKPRNRWVWVYDHEAKTIGLHVVSPCKTPSTGSCRFDSLRR